MYIETDIKIIRELSFLMFFLYEYCNAYITYVIADNLFFIFKDVTVCMCMPW